MAEPFLGEIRMFGFTFAPRAWAECNGQLLPINQNQALFSLLGTMYGGDGRTTFALPDLRGRLAIGQGAGPSNNYSPGQRGGVESVSLNATHLPPHTHELAASTETADAQSPSGKAFATPDAHARMRTLYESAPDASGAAQGTTSTGSGSNHANIQPVRVVLYAIALQGIFPSRN